MSSGLLSAEDIWLCNCMCKQMRDCFCLFDTLSIDLYHLQTVLFLFLSSVKWRTKSCTWRHLHQFWVPWVLGLCWDLVLLSSLSSPGFLTLDYSWTITRPPGLGYDGCFRGWIDELDFHVPQSRTSFRQFVFNLSAVLHHHMFPNTTVDSHEFKIS